MSRSAHSHSNSIDLAVVSSVGSENRSAETAEQSNTLVVVHTVEGKILSMHWPQAVDCMGDEGYVGQSIESLFGPVAIVPYMEHVRQVVEQQSPQEFQCVIRCGQQPVGFDFVLSPLPAKSAIPMEALQTHGGPSALETSARNAAGVVGVGRRIVPQPIPITATNSVSDNGGSGYYALLATVASAIRKTLDINTIWQQTVTGLGNLLELDRCLVCDYSQTMQTVTVVAEYYQPNLHPCLGKTFALSAKADFLDTLQSLEPVISDFEQDGGELPYTVLTIATCYREQPNSILVLQQPPRQPWQPFEIDLIRELTDQVGTAIAHAKLFSESEAISRELRTKSEALRRTNRELTRKHQELEDAKRQAEDASRRKSDFLANTSHELRTPLNGMIGFLRLVLDGMADDEEEQLEFIQESHNSAIHLLNLINDVLDIAKIEANKMELELSAVSLQELMEEIDKSQRTHIENTGLKFKIALPATLDEIKLYSNYQRLKQVLLNLVSNANKFTHEGSITITAEISPQSFEFDNKSWPGLVKISVADTGIGVSLEKQDRLFQTFSQVDSARTRQYEGTGLGLAISQRLVEAMGGKVKFISMGEGLGATVTFTTVLYQEPVMELGAT